MRADVVRAALMAEIAAAQARVTAPEVLDVGGGSGGWAVPLASAGCRVTVVDPSPNALAALRRRAGEAGVAQRISAVQGDVDTLAQVYPTGQADVVLGHGLLEFVDNAEIALSALVNAAASGGAVSVLVANRYAALLSRALAGRIGEAQQVLADPSGRTGVDDRLQRRFSAEELVSLLSGAGLTIEILQGDRILTDLVSAAVLGTHPDADDELARLELAIARKPPLRDMATRLHVIGRRP